MNNVLGIANKNRIENWFEQTLCKVQVVKKLISESNVKC